MQVYARWLDWLLPERCPRCAGPSARGLCTACRGSLPRLGRTCRRCGLPWPPPRCPAETHAWSLEAVVAPFGFGPPLDGLIHEAKFRGGRSMARALGLVLAEALQAHGADVDAVIPVPLHPVRLRARGYNQADEIARPIAQRLRVPIVVAGITRVRPTDAQSALGAPERRRNLHGAFAITCTVPHGRYALVDDVITTGATINALATVLRTAGAGHVHAWAIARALPPGAARPDQELPNT
jgi:ComF family protein